MEGVSSFQSLFMKYIKKANLVLKYIEGPHIFDAGAQMVS